MYLECREAEPLTPCSGCLLLHRCVCLPVNNQLPCCPMHAAEFKNVLYQRLRYSLPVTQITLHFRCTFSTSIIMPLLAEDQFGIFLILYVPDRI